MATADFTTVGMLKREGDGDSTLTRPHWEPLFPLVILQLRILPPLLLAKPEEINHGFNIFQYLSEFKGNIYKA